MISERDFRTGFQEFEDPHAGTALGAIIRFRLAKIPARLEVTGFHHFSRGLAGFEGVEFSEFGQVPYVFSRKKIWNRESIRRFSRMPVDLFGSSVPR
jgi:hypothetical protein